MGQFDDAARGTATRSTRKTAVGEVALLEIQGTYSAGMGQQGAQPGWALLGAIVPAPGMPYFFKLTGPVKSVLAARSELDTLVSSLKLRKGQGT
jgi:hypothetical protein